MRGLRSVTPETPLELKLRKELEFDALEQGRAGHVKLYVKFKKLLFELKDARRLNLIAEDVAYITKICGNLRGEVMRRKMLFPVELASWGAHTWEESKLVCDEVTRETRNLSVLKDINQLQHAKAKPSGGKGGKSGGAGSTMRCKQCHQPGHPAALCPTEAAKKRGEVEKARAFHAERVRFVRVRV